MTLVRPEAGASKHVWRDWAKRRREELELVALSAKLAARLERWPDYRRARHVLLYLAFGSELDLSGLDTRGKSPYATRSHQRERRLSIHPLDGGLDRGLERHPLGFLQPAATAEVDPQLIDLALVPGLLFDTSGQRLGYGLGFYDRFLPRLRRDALLVGVTAEALVVPALPASDHDVPVTHLLTEAGVRKAAPS
ncbi:MAG: 5-formyltetrahydrofolate cyclo-ligase [Deinococcota bacterium]|nr:5-formyltetrahydrofolate cyclo-ligase [Deinococcota bacterium]